MHVIGCELQVQPRAKLVILVWQCRVGIIGNVVPGRKATKSESFIKTFQYRLLTKMFTKPFSIYISEIVHIMSVSEKRNYLSQTRQMFKVWFHQSIIVVPQKRILMKWALQWNMNLSKCHYLINTQIHSVFHGLSRLCSIELYFYIADDAGVDGNRHEPGILDLSR